MLRTQGTLGRSGPRYARTALLIATLSIWGCSSLPASDRALSAEYQRFLSWWGGDYDNLKQIRAQEAGARPVAERNTPLRLFIRKVDLPAFGPDAYYAEWQDARDASKVTRQRIYAFEIDRQTRALRLNLHIWPIDRPDFLARTRGAYLDPRRLAGVSPADMAGLRGCDVFFAKDIRGFSGAMRKGSCAFPAPDGTPIYSWSQMSRSARQFRYLDGWFNVDGTVYRRLSFDWDEFDKR